MAQPTLTKAQIGKLLDKAHKAGMEAGNGVTPTPMVVGTPTTLFGNDIDTSKPVYVVNDGVCGFASIAIHPANSRLARVAKERGMGYVSSMGGFKVSVREFNQSLTRKEAYARAFANVLREAGFNRVYVESRID